VLLNNSQAGVRALWLGNKGTTDINQVVAKAQLDHTALFFATTEFGGQFRGEDQAPVWRRLAGLAVRPKREKFGELGMRAGGA